MTKFSIAQRARYQELLEILAGHLRADSHSIPCLVEPTLFTAGSSRAALKCGGCPAASACRKYGLMFEQSGVWGGTRVSRAHNPAYTAKMEEPLQ